jgi:hypothetical protein
LEDLYRKQTKTFRHHPSRQQHLQLQWNCNSGSSHSGSYLKQNQQQLAMLAVWKQQNVSEAAAAVHKHAVFSMQPSPPAAV